MTVKITQSPEVQALLDKLSGLDQAGGDARLKQIIRRIVGDLFATIDEFDISDDEFWGAMNFCIAGAQEYGLWAAGLGIERFLDMRADAADAQAGITGGTPRTIEGPLYVAGAPEAEGAARMDDGSEDGKGELMVLHGQVRDTDGNPVAGAKVEAWHANTLGNYSIFDQSQTPFNLRRTVFTDADGRYAFRSFIPTGYGCPEGGSTDRILKAIGRHGNRPAHVHYFVSKPGMRHLTTQINIEGDPYIFDDFAYATREELVPTVNRVEGGELGQKLGINGAYADIQFDIVLNKAASAADEKASTRARAAA